MSRRWAAIADTAANPITSNMRNSAATSAGPTHAGAAVAVSCLAAERSQRRQLYELFEQCVLTDVELIVQGEPIAAHRVILAAASPFFHALFTSGMKESHEFRIELHEVNAPAFRELLAYMYTGQLQITGETILAILHTANQLEMLEVVEICCKQLILELNVSNCVDIYVCCASLKSRAPCRTLAHAALAMIEAFLVDVMETDAFLHLPLALVARILLRQRQQKGSEAALWSWVSFDPATRRQQLAAIKTSSSYLPPYLMPIDGAQRKSTTYPPPSAFDLTVPSTTPLAATTMATIFAIGGFNGPQALRTVEYLDFHSNEWYAVASMHERRSYSGVVVTRDQRIIVLGGSCNSRHLKTVELYDPETNSWELMPPMRKSRSYLGAGIIGDHIYVVGGFNGMSHLATVERFDPATQCWEEMTPLQVGRSGLSIVSAGGYLYAIGGYDGRRHLKSVEVYDPQRNEWTLLPSTMRHARNGPAAVLLEKKNQVLVFGGESRHGLRMNTAERLNLETGEWEDVDPLLDSRSGHVALSVLRDSFIFCFGGSNKKDEYVDAVHRYDPLNKQWSLHSRMLSQRCGLNVAILQVSRDAACFDARLKLQRGDLREDGVTSSPSGVESIGAFSSSRARFA